MSEENKPTKEEIDEARAWLKGARIFFPEHMNNEEEGKRNEDCKKTSQTINLNDVWAWACSDGTEVEDEELPELARLVRAYGWCGVLFFSYKKDDRGYPEFDDVARFVQFVEHEEALRADKDYEEAAYTKLVYTLGEVTARSRCKCSDFINWHAKSKGKCGGSRSVVEGKCVVAPCSSSCESFELVEEVKDEAS